MTPPFFGSKIMNLLVFFNFEPKKCFRAPTPWGLYGAEWDEPLCSLCSFQPFLLCLPSLALLRAGQNPCQRREMTVSTNNGLVNGPVHNPLMQLFILGSSKSKFLKLIFFLIL